MKSKVRMVNMKGNHFGMKLEDGGLKSMKKEKGRIKWLDTKVKDEIEERMNKE